MNSVVVECSRCHREVRGFEFDSGTTGFYRVEFGFWAKFARPGEKILCDECMSMSPGYSKEFRSDDLEYAS